MASSESLIGLTRSSFAIRLYLDLTHFRSSSFVYDAAKYVRAKSQFGTNRGKDANTV